MPAGFSQLLGILKLCSCQFLHRKQTVSFNQCPDESRTEGLSDSGSPAADRTEARQNRRPVRNRAQGSEVLDGLVRPTQALCRSGMLSHEPFCS